MPEHSLIPPSSAGIWGKPDGCTAWVLMSQQFPETETSPESAEGTATHEIGSQLIREASRGESGATAENFIGETASNGVIFTEEMFDAAKMYADDVAAVMRSTAVFGGLNLGIEQRIEAKRIHDLSFGTPDCFLYAKAVNTLYLWDFKFGYAPVDVFENWQCLNYSAGLIERLEIDGLVDQQTVIKIRIIQPRAFHRDGPIREWEVLASDLRGYFNQLHAGAHEALGPNPICRTGTQCKNCSARQNCMLAIRAGVQLFEIASAPMPVELSPAALGTQFAIVKRAREQIKCLEAGFETQIKSLIKSGKPVPGWCAEMGVGRERWARPVAEVITLGSMLGVELRKPDEAITPNQARKLGIDEAVITAYSEKPRAGLKVVPDNGNSAKQVFEK